MSTPRGLSGLLLAILSLALVYFGYDELVVQSPSGRAPAPRATLVARTPAALRLTPAPARAGQGERAILDAFEARRSDLQVEGEGVVDRLLADDNEGSRHQRFILRLASGHTLLVSHNIDLAPRVPLEEGDPVRFYGEYEWSDRGGVLHWTHHDPAGRHPDGWIEHDGSRYR